jgi:hypothetical protein
MPPGSLGAQASLIANQLPMPGTGGKLPPAGKLMESFQCLQMTVTSLASQTTGMTTMTAKLMTVQVSSCKS